MSFTAPKPTTPPVPAGLVFTHNGHRYKMSQKPGPIAADNKFAPVTGVTTILNGGVPKPALVRWAPRIVAEWVADPANRAQLDALLAGDPLAAVRELKELPTKARDEAGVRGTAVHALAEELHRTGEAPDVPEELLGFVEGYVQFLDDWQITPVLMERPCGNRKDWWAGTFDLLCTSPFLAGGKLVQIDLKTSRGIYGETALQTGAYSKAEFYVDEHSNEQPMPEVHATYVAHVTAEGTRLYELGADKAAIERHYQLFLTAAFTHKTTKEREAIIGEPLTIPNTEMSAAA